MQNIFEFVKTLTKGTMGVEVVTLTEPKMNKKGNPYFGRVTKRTIYHNAMIGYGYANTINNRIERQSGERGEFVAEPMSGKQWAKGYEGLFEQSLKDENQYYLRLTFNKATKATSCYYIDGRSAYDSEVAEIKSFMPSRGYSAKQAAAGLVEEQVEVRGIKVENVLIIKQGKKVYDKQETRLAV